MFELGLPYLRKNKTQVVFNHDHDHLDLTYVIISTFHTVAIIFKKIVFFKFPQRIPGKNPFSAIILIKFI